MVGKPFRTGTERMQGVFFMVLLQTPFKRITRIVYRRWGSSLVRLSLVGVMAVTSKRDSLNDVSAALTKSRGYYVAHSIKHM
jgi:hypothetical protein